MELVNFKRTLLLFTYQPEVQTSIQQSREATREHDVAAISLEVVSLTTDHIAGLIKKSDDLMERIRTTQETIIQTERQITSVTPPSELNNAYLEVLDELKDLQGKNAKILEHVCYFNHEFQ